MSSTVTHSVSESKILDIKIGRCDLIKLDIVTIEKIKNEIIEGGFDICRLKLLATEPNIYSCLELLGFPYFILNINHVFEIIPCEKYPINKNITFKIIGEQASVELLKTIVQNCFFDSSGNFFRNPLTSGVVSKEMELTAMTTYVVEKIHDSNYWLRLIYFKKVPIGFVLYKLFGDILTGELFGLVPEYRQKGLSKDIGAYVLNEFQNRRVINHVKIQNIPSIRTHFSLGLKLTQTILNVHLVSYLQSKDFSENLVPLSVHDYKNLLFGRILSSQNSIAVENNKSITLSTPDWTIPVFFSQRTVSLKNSKLNIYKIFQKNKVIGVSYHTSY